MKKYLISTIKNVDLKKVYNLYENWNLEKIKNIDLNREVYNKFNLSTVDSIYIFGNKLEKMDDFFITSPDIYATKDGIYYYDYIDDKFEKFENNSQIYILRKSGLESKFLSFLKKYGKEKFNIDFYGISSINDSIGLKRFGIYFGYMTGLQNHIPYTVIPSFGGEIDLDLLIRFLKFYFNGKYFLLKKSSSSRGGDINIFSNDNIGSDINIKSALNNLIDKNIFDINFMELIDIKKEEFRVLWHKIGKKIEIIGMYKRVKLENQIILEPSKGDNLEIIKIEELDKKLISDIKSIVKFLPEDFGGLDVMFGFDGNHYFLENNNFTGYLASDLEYPILKNWLNGIIECI